MQRINVLCLAIAVIMTVSTVVEAATSTFGHDLSPPLHEFIAPRAFLAQRFATRRAQEEQQQLLLLEERTHQPQPTSASRSARVNSKQWNIRGGGGTEKGSPAALVVSAASNVGAQSLSSSNFTKTLFDISTLLFAECVHFAGSHLEPLGHQLGAIVTRRWQPTLHLLRHHSKFLAGIAVGLLLMR